MTNTINLREQCDLLRSQWKQFSMSIKHLITAAKSQKVAYSDSCDDTGEVIANLTLAYRHSEDAVMRLGKAIQADQWGESIYDKAKDTTWNVSDERELSVKDKLPGMNITILEAAERYKDLSK